MLSVNMGDAKIEIGASIFCLYDEDHMTYIRDSFPGAFDLKEISEDDIGEKGEKINGFYFLLCVCPYVSTLNSFRFCCSFFNSYLEWESNRL